MDISGKFQAFYVAMQQDQADKAVEQLLLYSPDQYLCCGEVTEHGHAETSGFHMHFFCTISDKQYRALIAKLKSIGFLMRGRAEPNLPRTYGKVKFVRDNIKMAAYTIKSASVPALMWTNFDQDLIKYLMSISFVKEEKESVEDVFRYINENFSREEERISLLAEEKKEIPFQLLEPPMQLKVCILRYYRSHGDLKPPTRSKVNYIATRWALKESSWDLDSVAYYFYR